MLKINKNYYLFFFLLGHWIQLFEIIALLISWKIIIIDGLNVLVPFKCIISYSHSTCTFQKYFICIILLVYAFIKSLLLFGGTYDFSLHIWYCIIDFISSLTFFFFFPAVFPSLDLSGSLYKTYLVLCWVIVYSILLPQFTNILPQ